MSIATELQRIRTAKENIKEAIKAKGVDVSDSDKIDVYPSKIGQITGGGGEPFDPNAFHLYYVEFYDGEYHNRLAQEIKAGDIIELEQGKDVPAMNTGTSRANPELIWDEWACPFAYENNTITIPEYITSDLFLGAIYHPSDGLTHCILKDGQDKTSNYFSQAVRVYYGINMDTPYTISSSMRSLEIVSFSNTITNIPTNTFGTVSFCLSIIIPNSVVTIDDITIQQFTKTFVFGYNVTSMKVYAYACKNWWFPEKITSYSDLPYYPTEVVDITLPDSVTAFPFKGEYLKRFRIPRDLKAFSLTNGWNLTYLDINAKTFIQSYTLTTAIFVEELTLPKTLTSIGSSNFIRFLSLRILHCLAEIPPTLEDLNLLVNCPIKIIYVPKGYLEVYQNATNWTYAADKMVEMD